jgi:hypothetical protein
LTDTILKGDHLRIISTKFGWDWLHSFRGEDFFLNFHKNLLVWIHLLNKNYILMK